MILLMLNISGIYGKLCDFKAFINRTYGWTLCQIQKIAVLPKCATEELACIMYRLENVYS